MEDLFEVLIYLFIIVSFLSSIFKKKGKPKSTKSGQPYKPPVQTYSRPKTPQEEEYDILREIENMFKTESSPAVQQQESAYDEESPAVSSEHTKTSEWKTPTYSEHSKTDSEHSRESRETEKSLSEARREIVSEKIISQAELFEQNLRQKSQVRTDSVHLILQKLRRPESIKDYIVVSEIIGKPKSLLE